MSISIKLHLARCIYSLIWQAKLPLSLESSYLYSEKKPIYTLLLKRLKLWITTGLMLPINYKDVQDIKNSSKLPLFMALDCGVLHGFQMQAANEFYASINNPEMLEQLFEVNTMVGCRSWRDLSNIVMNKVNDFRTELATLLNQDQSGVHDSFEGTPPRAQGRSLIRPSTEGTFSQYNQNDIEMEDEGSPPDPLSIFQIYSLHNIIANLIQNHWLFVKMYDIWHQFSAKNNPLAELNRILISAEPLAYSLQGVVAICVCSLKNNNRYVIWDEDVKCILKAVLELKNELAAIEDHEILNNTGKLCSSYQFLRLAVSRCMYQLLLEYKDYLEILFIG
ncbi:uncharacterized protein [Drosophila tropicalis]|uniref:uncharacterized protein n=1 Tax=Drosophila tropicalis TaxID=46794 RepID=UPI0035ABDE6D